MGKLFNWDLSLKSLGHWIKRPINIYRIILSIFIFTSIIRSNLWTWPYFSVYYFAAMAGLYLFEKRSSWLYLTSQITIIFVLICVLTGSNTCIPEDFIIKFSILHVLNTIIFLGSSAFLFFYLFSVFIKLRVSVKWQRRLLFIFNTLILTVGMYIIFYGRLSHILKFEYWFTLAFIFLIPFMLSIAATALILKWKDSQVYLYIFEYVFMLSVIVWVWGMAKEGFTYRFNVLDKTVVTYFITGIFLIGAIVYLWFFAFLTFRRRRLVVKLEQFESTKPISIYPDPSMYQDVHGKAAWLRDFIRKSDGGVIGLTGLRGAGKSSLLNKVLDDLKDEYFTLHISSPVHTSDRLEFFMMVCREVCSKVIAQLNSKIFRANKNVKSVAREEQFKIVRFIMLMTILLLVTLSIWYNLRLNKENTALEGYKYNFNTILYESEKYCIDTLTKELNTILKDSNSSIEQYTLITSPIGGMIHIVPLVGKSSSSLGLILRFKEYFTKKSQYEYSTDEDSCLRLVDFYSNHLDFSLSVEDQGKVYLTQVILPNLYFDEIHNKFFHRNMCYFSQHSNKFIYELYQDGYFDIVLMDKFASSFANIVNVNPYFDEYVEGKAIPKLVSWILIESMFNPVKGDTKHMMVFQKAELKLFRDLLSHYQNSLRSYFDKKNWENQIYVRNWEKKHNTENNTLPPVSIKDTLKDTIVHLFSNNWILGGFTFLIIFIVFSQAFFRWFSFNMALVSNIRQYGLLKRSRQFLALLSYSESTQRGGKLSLSSWIGLSASLTKTERNLTLPGMTNMFIEYIQEVSELFNNKMIICIDELDKIDDIEVVKHILKEIKGALFVKNTFYLISISQDAARSFQHRLSSGRDIFESTFDELIFLPRLGCKQAWSVIKLRLDQKKNNELHSLEEELSEPVETRNTRERHGCINSAAITLNAGGIPREIVRNLRDVILQPRDMNGDIMINSNDRNTVPHDHSTLFELDKISALKICVFLLRNNLQQVKEAISDMMLSGESGIELYSILIDIEQDFLDETFVFKENLSTLFHKLDRCILIIDPEKLYLSISPGSEPGRQEKYISAKRDLQLIMELTIKAHIIAYFFEHPILEKIDESFENRIISAFEMLENNPGLAMHILRESP
jgi:hypothetical protein